MPIMKFYPNGGSAGNPNPVNTHQRAKRGKVQGWTPRAARNQRNFFFSVDTGSLTGHGFSFTLTLRDCPPTAAEFHRMRDALMKRLARLGMIRGHWLVEWQRRGVPHLHGVAYFEDANAGYHIVSKWLEIASDFGAGLRGQDCKPIHAIRGWLQYLAKHGSRGVSHYQRSNDNVPKEWKEKTGRLWGKVGDWPIREPMRFRVDREGYWQYRRVVRRYCLSAARKESNWRSVSYLRRMLKSADRPTSEVRGVADWVPLDVQIRIVLWLGSEGCRVVQVLEDDDG